MEGQGINSTRSWQILNDGTNKLTWKSLVPGNGTRKVNRKIVVQDEGYLPSELYEPEYKCKLLAHLWIYDGTLHSALPCTLQPFPCHSPCHLANGDILSTQLVPILQEVADMSSPRFLVSGRCWQARYLLQITEYEWKCIVLSLYYDLLKCQSFNTTNLPLVWVVCFPCNSTYFSNSWYGLHQFPHPHIGRPSQNSECLCSKIATSEQSKYMGFDNFDWFCQFRAFVVMKPRNCFEKEGVSTPFARWA